MKRVLTVAMAVFMLGGSVAAWAADLTVKGSTTVLPIAQKCVEAYMKANPGVTISLAAGDFVSLYLIDALILGEREGIFVIESQVGIVGYVFQCPLVPQQGMAEITIFQVGIAQIVVELPVIDPLPGQLVEGGDGR